MGESNTLVRACRKGSSASVRRSPGRYNRGVSLALRPTSKVSNFLSVRTCCEMCWCVQTSLTICGTSWASLTVPGSALRGKCAKPGNVHSTRPVANPNTGCRSVARSGPFNTSALRPPASCSSSQRCFATRRLRSGVSTQSLESFTKVPPLHTVRSHPHPHARHKLVPQPVVAYPFLPVAPLSA